MSRFRVRVERTLTYVIDVEAENDQEAVVSALKKSYTLAAGKIENNCSASAMPDHSQCEADGISQGYCGVAYQQSNPLNSRRRP